MIQYFQTLESCVPVLVAINLQWNSGLKLHYKSACNNGSNYYEIFELGNLIGNDG